MSDYIRICKEIFQLFNNYNSIGFYFVTAVLFLWLKSKNKYLKYYYLYPSVIVLLVIVNPIVIKIVVQGGMMIPERYVRLYWLLPISGVTAYICVQGVKLLNEKLQWKKIEAVILISLLLFASGSYMFSSDHFHEATNYYKLPNGVVEVTDVIRQDVLNSGKSLDEVRVLAPTELSIYMRQYDGHVKLLYGRNPILPIESLLVATEIDVDALQAEARPRECGYVIINSGKNYIGSMEESGYQLVDETSGYVIYKDMKL